MTPHRHGPNTPLCLARHHPDCQGDARWDDLDQAEYVAKGHTREFGTKWVAVRHRDHYHLRDTGKAV